MTTYVAEQLQDILASHGKWLASEGGACADLRNADLRDADLRGADLRGAYLSNADLSGVTLPTGESWETYLTEVVPALLVAGGREIAAVATPETWACHDWSNCPMHAAFRARELPDVPALHRPRAKQFVQLFDAGLIPLPALTESAAEGHDPIA